MLSLVCSSFAKTVRYWPYFSCCLPANGGPARSRGNCCSLKASSIPSVAHSPTTRRSTSSRNGLSSGVALRTAVALRVSDAPCETTTMRRTDFSSSLHRYRRRRTRPPLHSRSHAQEIRRPSHSPRTRTSPSLPHDGRRKIDLLASMWQAVAVFLLLGAAVPLIKPRLPLPAKNATAVLEKKEKEEEEAGAEPPTPKKLLRNLGLWVFMVANIAQGFAYFSSTLWLPSFGTVRPPFLPLDVFFDDVDIFLPSRSGYRLLHRPPSSPPSTVRLPLFPYFRKHHTHLPLPSSRRRRHLPRRTRPPLRQALPSHPRLLHDALRLARRVPHLGLGGGYEFRPFTSFLSCVGTDGGGVDELVFGGD